MRLVTMTDAATDPRIADIAKTGHIRLGLFLPQYAETSTGDINPVGAGLVAHELVGALAEHLSTTVEIVPQPSPPKAVESLNAGGCDVICIGIEESRRKVVEFTPAVFQFDFAYLVPSGSPIMEANEVDRSGIRISVPEGHAVVMALQRFIKHAEIVYGGLPDEAFTLIRDGKADIFALPRERLFDYAAMLPGSRILAQGFGVNHVGLAVANGRTQHLSFISDFVREAKASGLVSRILDDTDLTSRGFSVAI
jgi:polar amino acid transport system substrate-binding protein